MILCNLSDYMKRLPEDSEDQDKTKGLLKNIYMFIIIFICSSIRRQHSGTRLAISLSNLQSVYTK